VRREKLEISLSIS